MEERIKHVRTCSKCWETFIYFPNEVSWDHSGTESVKLVNCPFCGKTQTIRYEKQVNANYDERYYE